MSVLTTSTDMDGQPTKKQKLEEVQHTEMMLQLIRHGAKEQHQTPGTAANSNTHTTLTDVHFLQQTTPISSLFNWQRALAVELSRVNDLLQRRQVAEITTQAHCRQVRTYTLLCDLQITCM